MAEAKQFYEHICVNSQLRRKISWIFF